MSFIGSEDEHSALRLLGHLGQLGSRWRRLWLAKPGLWRAGGFLRTVREHPPYQTCCVENGMFSDNPPQLSRLRVRNHPGPRQEFVVIGLGAEPQDESGLVVDRAKTRPPTR